MLFEGLVVGGRQYSAPIPYPDYGGKGEWVIYDGPSIPNSKQTGDRILVYKGQDICALTPHNVLHAFKGIKLVRE